MCAILEKYCILAFANGDINRYYNLRNCFEFY